MTSSLSHVSAATSSCLRGACSHQPSVCYCNCHNASGHNCSRRHGTVSPSIRRHRTSLQTGMLLLIIVVVLPVSFLTGCSAEQPFHHRFRDDARQRRLHGQRVIQVVTDRNTAMRYLITYGYLRCAHDAASGIHRRDVDDTLEVFEEDGSDEASDDHPSQQLQGAAGGEEPLPPCDDDTVRSAILLYQTRYSLVQTGEIDDDTMAIMNKQRCGNSDTEKETELIARAHRSDIARVPHASDSVSGSLQGSLSGGGASGASEDADPHVVEKRALNTRAAPTRKRRSLMNLLTKNDEWVERYRIVEHEEDPQTIRREMMAELSRESQTRKRWGLMHPDDSTNQPPSTKHLSSPRRRRRDASGVSGSSDVNGVLLGLDAITWRILGNAFSTSINYDTQKEIISMALRIWSEVLPIDFSYKPTGDINDVVVRFGWGKESHLSCQKKFDGPGGEIAHTYGTASAVLIHYDDDECFISDPNGEEPGCLSLHRVALHEVGHVLSLNHSLANGSVMYPVSEYMAFELSGDDRKAAQAVYGVCGGKFDSIFDWLREKQEEEYINGVVVTTIKYVYSTYFFRSRSYWMYENRSNRTRFGDPRRISYEWHGVEDDIDAVVQIREKAAGSSSRRFKLHTLFFKGEFWYRYNDTRDVVARGFPKRISDGWSPTDPRGETIPDNINAAYYDLKWRELHFFKNYNVWTLDPHDYLKGDNDRDPIMKRAFSELFTMASGTPDALVVTGKIDSMYYSYNNKTSYLFKGEQVYEVSRSGGRTYVLTSIGPWYDLWFDICDV